jgi:hypothetical protein
VQLKRTSHGKLVAFELNGRFTGGTAPRVVLGFDDVGEVFKRFLPEFAFEPIAPSGADVAQNYLCSYAVPREAVATLRASGKWSR